MNIAMFPHFVSIINILGMRLLCYYILTILLTLVVSSRLWLIIRWISIKFWLIIRWIMLSTIFPIMILFYFTKMMCLWNYYIYSNFLKTCNYFWLSTDNYNIFIFDRWFISMLINIFGRVLCIVKWTFCCCCCG